MSLVGCYIEPTRILGSAKGIDMYHRFVAAQVRKAFAQISAGNWEAMVDGMAPTFTYRFYGDHALSGERHTHEALRRWWERCFRLLPETRFEVQEVLVELVSHNVPACRAEG